MPSITTPLPAHAHAHMPITQSKNWMFTLFDYTEEDTQKVKDLVNNPTPKVKTLIFQEEICPSSNRKHLQGYIVVDSPRGLRLGGIKKLFPGNPHLETRLGSHKQAIEYCTKNETRLPEGIRFVHDSPDSNNQGKRSDLLAIKESVDENRNENELWELHFPQMVKYYSGLSRYIALKQVKRNWKSFVSVYWGTTGSGKSYSAHYEAGEDSYTLSPGQRPQSGVVYFEGFNGQSNVIFEEFHGGSMQWQQLLNLLDEHPATVMIKGSSKNFAPR